MYIHTYIHTMYIHCLIFQVVIQCIEFVSCVISEDEEFDKTKIIIISSLQLLQLLTTLPKQVYTCVCVCVCPSILPSICVCVCNTIVPQVGLYSRTVNFLLHIFSIIQEEILSTRLGGDIY